MPVVIVHNQDRFDLIAMLVLVVFVKFSSFVKLKPPPEQRPLKNFPGASQEANKNLNLARRKHSEMVDKVVAVENDIRMMQERYKKANEERVALDQLVVYQGTLQEVKRVIQGGLAKLNNV